MEFKEALKEILTIKGVSALCDKDTVKYLDDCDAFDNLIVFRQILGTIIEMDIGNVLINVFCQSIIDDKGVSWKNLKTLLSKELAYDDYHMNMFFDNLEYAFLGYISGRGNTEREINTAVEELQGRIWTDYGGVKYSLDKKKLYNASEIETGGIYQVDTDNEEICPYAFQQNSNISDIRFSEKLKIIGACAFQGCPKLSRVRFKNDNVTIIGEHAFGGCGSLEEVYLPGKLLEISEGLFSVCTNLLYVYIPKTVKSIGASAFYDCHSLQFAVIPDSVNYIGDQAFHYCLSLSYVVLPLGLTTVGERVFDDCRSLQYIYIPEGSYSKFSRLLPSYSRFFREYSSSKPLFSGFVGDYKTFITRSGEIIVRNIYPLREVCDVMEINNYKEGLSRTGTYIYKEDGHRYYLSPILKYKSAAEIIAIGESITVADLTINNGRDWILFAYMSDYESFDTIYNIMPSEWFYETTGHNMSPLIMQSDIDNYYIDGQGVAYSKDMKRLIKAPENIVNYSIHEGVEVICDRAFENCTHLQSIKIPSSVAFIGYASFRCCKTLESVVIPSSVKSIDSFAFRGCSSIRSFQMSEGLLSIGDGAFYCCLFTNIDIPKTVLYIGKGAFSFCRKLEVMKISPSVIYIGEGAFHRLSRNFDLKQIPSLDIRMFVPEPHFSYTRKEKHFIYPKSN